jgi:enterochelin esterase family protein
MPQSMFIDSVSVSEFQYFLAGTIVVQSDVLKGNALGDPTVRKNPVLIPKGSAPVQGWPVVLVLSGLFGNGPHAFNLKVFEPNTPEAIDQCAGRGEAPRAVFAFCDAMTFWGGSQFLDSAGTGRYETFVLRELVPAIRTHLPAAQDSGQWCVTGGSSGGYGALHLASRAPEVFGRVAAIAPDSFFEASLLPAVRTALPVIDGFGGVAGVRSELISGRFMKRKDAHEVLNAIAMGLCYAPDEHGNWRSPVDPETGILIDAEWDRWKAHDPVVFLGDRIDNLRRLEAIYLDVGTRDQYHLQYGTRQIAAVLREYGIHCDLTQFDGTHWDIGERKPEVWKWLANAWGGSVNFPAF